MRKSKQTVILDVATELFKEFGIKRVTVEEICAKAEVSKATFYKYFANKTQLALHIVTTLYETGSERFKRKMAEGAPFDDLIKEILVMKLEFMEAFSPNFMKDLYEGAIPELQEHLVKMQKESLDAARPLYDIGIKQGMIDPAVTFEYFLYLLDYVQQTYTDPNVIAIYPNQKERFKVTFNQFFFGLMGQSRSNTATDIP